ncbi:MAG: endolytic transglycosylase MltG [Pseudomonadota bacterium]
MSDPVRFGRAAEQPMTPPPPPPAGGGAGDAQEQAPKTRGRKKRADRNQFVVFFNFLFSLLVFTLIGMGAALYFGKGQFEARGPHDVGTTYTVRSGASVGSVANDLRRQGLISNSRIFEYGVRAYGNETALKAGEYDIAAGASMKSIMDTLVEGRAILYPLTIVEGWTVFRAMQEIAANEFLTGEMPTELPPEGSLIADTQKFGRGTDRAELIARMQAQQTRIVEQIWEKRAADLPINDINEFVTLASIVEKETGVGDERPRVAGVFINRLNRGMRLQSDPTIIYGIFGGEGKPSDRPIYRSDIDTPTDYNTYTIDGLPPGPIAIPGRASLEAVANPARTNDLFFVADGTGGHAFAETLEDHNRNVARWREIERQREAEAESSSEN